MRFGNIERIEIRKLSCFSFANNSSTMINEYDSNMEKSIYDRLTTIEAKNVIYGAKNSESFELTILIKRNLVQVLA